MPRRYYSETILVRSFRIRKSILRRMEDEGFIEPVVKAGERRYSIEQVQDIIFARELMEDMGVNLAGVEVALTLRRNMRLIETQIEELFEYIRERLEEEMDDR